MPDLYAQVPKELDANLSFRSKIYEWGMKEENRQDLWTMCARDPLFFMNVFGWIFEPRKNDPRIKGQANLPYITYDFQDELVLKLIRAIENETGLYIEKTRDMGVSWVGVFVYTWYLIFRPDTKLGMASATEDDVDKTGESDALFWKIDYAIENLPGWMRPKIHRTKLHIGNLDNESCIDGSATGPDMFRGGRKKAIWLDEFAAFDQKQPGMGRMAISSIANVTECMVYCSTHKGVGTEFYNVKEQRVLKGTLPAMRLHWTIHPKHSIGLYKDDKGKERSPWYDKKCDEMIHESTIASELDINPHGSASQFFPQEDLDKVESETCRPPNWVGDIVIDEDDCDPRHLVKRGDGSLSMWIHVNENRAMIGNFTVACDIAMGTGASSSVAQIIDNDTGEQVGEWVSNHTRQERFAEIAVSLAKWFGGAYLAWEDSSVAAGFRMRVVESGYRHLYKRKKVDKTTKERTEKLGWNTNTGSKKAMLERLLMSIKRGQLTIRSRELVLEARQYIIDTTGKVIHQAEKNVADPSGRNDNHGDRAMAMAVGNIASEEKRPEIKKSVTEVKPFTFAARIEGRREERRRELSESLDY